MSSGTLDGWLSAKKTKKEIARDPSRARDARKSQRKKPVSWTPNEKTSGKGRSAGRSKPKKHYGLDDDDDDDSYFLNDDVDEEVVPSESEEEEDFDFDEEEDEEDEEDLVHDDDDDDDDETDDDDKGYGGGRKAAGRARPGAGAPPSDDDDDDESDSFLPTGRIRPSVPSNLLRANARAAKRGSGLEAHSRSVAAKKARTNAGGSRVRLQAPALKAPGPLSSAVRSKYDDDDDDDEELTSPQYTPKKAHRGKSRPNLDAAYDELFSSDEENSHNGNGKRSASHKNAGGPSKKAGHRESTSSGYFTASARARPVVCLDDFSSDDDDDDGVTGGKARNQGGGRSALEDTPERQGVNRRLPTKKPGKPKGIAIHDSSDEEEVVRIDLCDDDDDDEGFDEDTRVAMRLSLQDHQKQKQKQKQKPKPKPKKAKAIDVDDEEEEDAKVEALLNDSSEDEGDDPGGEDYVDEEKETATSVLRTAEQLSRHVVRAMSGWFENGSGSGGAVQGIIADGAVALGNAEIRDQNEHESGGDASGHRWIGPSVMKQACPKVTLSPYQLVGVNWMALLNGMTCEVGTKGTKNVNGVLADEMGLGKTVQTIAFLAWLRHRRRKEAKGRETLPPLPHLIVVPVSTLPNWKREFEKFCPGMNVMTFYGSQVERECIKSTLGSYLPKNRHLDPPVEPELHVILAPVSYFSKENSPDRKFLTRFNYDYMVVDEAHNLKNAKSTRYKMLDKVRTEHRLLLTGTPVQNNPQELLNMLSFIIPLFSKAGASFEEKDNYTEQMLKHFVDASVEDEDEQAAYRKLKQLFAPFVLRRKKDDVIHQMLPKKERKTVFVELSKPIRSVYDSIIRSHFEKNGTTVNPGTGEHLFTNLRKCAHHPLLLRNRWNTTEERDRLIEDLIRFGAFRGEACTKGRVGEEIKSWNDFDIHLTALNLIDENEHRRPFLQKYVLDQEDLFDSTKFDHLRGLLPRLVKEGHRILIFSSWTSCLDLLGCLMEYLGIQFLRMDGSCPSKERQRLIDLFNSDPSHSVFLLSTKACGLGINLTSADTCILHDLDFNPFNDLQAEDRCHRIGQKKPVTVYKLITRDSVDEDIFKMQEKKAKMNAAIMDPASSKKEKNAILKSVLDRASRASNDGGGEMVQ